MQIIVVIWVVMFV